MENDIISMSGDGAPVNIKFGSISSPYFQLCLNHRIHLAVIKVFYKSVLGWQNCELRLY